MLLLRGCCAGGWLLSLAVLAVVIVCAAGAPWLAPYAPQRMDIAHRLAPPSGQHWFGSDDFGRDVLTPLHVRRAAVADRGLLVVLVSLACRHRRSASSPAMSAGSTSC